METSQGNTDQHEQRARGAESSSPTSLQELRTASSDIASVLSELTPQNREQQTERSTEVLSDWLDDNSNAIRSVAQEVGYDPDEAVHAVLDEVLVLAGVETITTLLGEGIEEEILAGETDLGTTIKDELQSYATVGEKVRFVTDFVLWKQSTLN